MRKIKNFNGGGVTLFRPAMRAAEKSMTLSLKLLWAEGLALEAQHFQQSDLYHEARLRHIAAAISPFSWGVQSARWNANGVRSHALAAHELTLIFEGGEIYQAPFCDDLPKPVDLHALAADRHSVVYYAALPLLKAHGGNLAGSDEARDGLRYAPLDAQTPDLYTDGLNVNVSYMKQSLRLLSEFDARDAYDCIPLVRLRRTADGGFEIDPTFMAPSLWIDAAPALREMLAILLGKLATRTAALYRLQRQPRGDTIEARGDDISSFWMLSVINTAHAALAHCAKLKHCHPEQLFEKMTALAGGLMTFSKKYAVSDLPGYSHDDPGPGFAALNAMIEELLDVVASSKYVTIALVTDQERPQYYVGQLDAQLVDGKTALYLAVSANMPALNLVAEVPRQLKIAAPGDIGNLVSMALSGIPVVHMAQVPAQVPVRSNTCYFSIDSRSALYEAVVKARVITIFAPSTLPELRLELFAIVD